MQGIKGRTVVMNGLTRENIMYSFKPKSKRLVIIKVDRDGSLRGRENRYYETASYFLSKDYSILICDNKEELSYASSFHGTIDIAEKSMKMCNFDTFEIYYIGIGSGASQFLFFAHNMENVKRAVLINPELIPNWNKIKWGIPLFKNIKIDVYFDAENCMFGVKDVINIYKNPNIKVHSAISKDSQFAYDTDKVIDICKAVIN